MMHSAILYAKAALPMIPGASLLPFVAGRGNQIPELERSLAGVTIDPGKLADYAHACGFTLRDTLPATYLHVCAFPLHMALMTDGRFPFPAVGLVHLNNRITVHRPATVRETFDLRVSATPLARHPKGQTFTLVTTAHVGDELVWEDHSTMLRRGGGGAANADSGREGGGSGDESGVVGVTDPQFRSHLAEWRLSGDLGRRYAGVSGDRNPIHLHAYTAKLFGFPRAIAHGMWTKARCLAALDHELPASYAVDVSFRKPILLPSTVTFATDEQRGFRVASARNPDTIHLEGTISA